MKNNIEQRIAQIEMIQSSVIAEAELLRAALAELRSAATKLMDAADRKQFKSDG